MKRLILIFGYVLPFFSVYAQHIQTSPLEYNPDKFFKKHGDMMIRESSKNLYPLGSDDFYIYDTLNIPFIDDFTTYTFKNYDQWSWQAPVDSMALTYRIIPGATNFPFQYRFTQTRHYEFDTVPVLSVDSSFLNPSYQLILFGDSANPFIPVDTLTIYPITSPRYYIDTLFDSIDSLYYSVDGTLYADSMDTIKVYYPIADNSLWIDNFTYRNSSMGIHPPSYGVVTFDGTNEYGEAYVPGGTNSFGIADYLTSKPINLSYPPGDSIYFSFFYQPQGRGYAPEFKDSLVVEFYSPVTKKWHHAHNIPGSSVDTFKQVLIPVSNSVFLQNGFRVRFKNYGNLAGNLDHWNIDYIRLDRNRSWNDTIIQDVTLVEVEPDILRRYTSMPYTQFTQADVDPKWNSLIANLDIVDKTISYKFELSDENGTVINRYTEDYTPLQSDTNIIQPVSVSGYSNYSRWSEPDFNYSFLSNGWLPLPDSTKFSVKHFLYNQDVDTNASNDTVIIDQCFYNYFAYDDGTAEQGLWLGTPGYVAMKFTANNPDTLRAIQFYFSPVKENVQSRFFTIKVWVGDLDTGEVYSLSRQIGVYPGDPSAFTNPYNNGYTTYYLEDTVVLPAGDFYVGWYQNQTYKINVGFDKNNNSRPYTFYKTTGVWDTLSLDGALMIRPMVGPPFSLQDVSVDPIDEIETDLNVFPNPASNQLFYQLPEDKSVKKITITDISGKLVSINNNITENYISVLNYPSGFYFLHFEMNEVPGIITKKIIVVHE